MNQGMSSRKQLMRYRSHRRKKGTGESKSLFKEKWLIISKTWEERWKLRVQDVCTFPKIFNSKKTLLRHIVIKLSKIKDRISEAGNKKLLTCKFSSVAQSCPTLCHPMNHSTPGLPVHHQLLEFTQTHVDGVGDAIQPSHPLSSPSPPAPNPSQH